MRKNRKTEKAKNLVVTNLTYCRLKAELAIIEEEIAGNQPLPLNEEQNVFKKALNAIATEVENERRRKAVQELTAEKKTALEALALFEREHGGKELALSQDLEKLKAFMQKELFKRDAYGLAKMQFALMLALDEPYAYQRPEESLQIVSLLLFDDPKRMNVLYTCFRANFKSIQQTPRDDLQAELLLGMSALSVVPFSLPLSILSMGATGVLAVWQHTRNQKRLKAALDSLSTDEIHTFLAIKLTLIQQSKGVMPEEKWKELIDDFLKYVNNFRSDSEYEWLVEQLDAPLCKEKIEVSDLCIARLAKIVGI